MKSSFLFGLLQPCVRKDYRRALFQAALAGDVPTQDVLAGQVDIT